MPLVPLLGSVRILLVGQYTCGAVYNYTTQYADFSVYICFPFHNVHIFHSYCIIVYSRGFIGYLQYCLQLLSPVYCLCCLHMLSFSQCDIFPQLLHNSLYNNVYSISSTYTYSTVYNYTTQYTVCVFTYTSFSQCDIFPQLLHNWLYNNVYSISSTYTYGIVYNYTTQYTDFAVYICFPFHNVIFFHNDCTIHSTTMSIAYPQHIHCPTKSIRTPPNIHVVNRLNIQLGAKMGIANIQVSKGVVLVLTLVEIFIILGFHEVLIY